MNRVQTVVTGAPCNSLQDCDFPAATRAAGLAAAAPVLLGVMLTLAACTAVGPDFVKPEAKVNTDWSQKDSAGLSSKAAADTAWWKAFNDPTLDQLIALAYRQNLSLQIAGLRILEARAQLGFATGRQYPQVQLATGEVTAVQISKNSPTYVPGFDNKFTNYQVGFDAAWEMDFWGKYRRGVESETAALAGSVADYDNALVTLTAEVARTYAVIRTYEVLVQQARTNADLQAEGLRIADARFRHGATSELDVTQATALLESTRATIPQLEASLRQATNALSTLLGQPTGTLEAMLAGAKGIPTAPAQVAVSIPAEMLRRRPDIRGAEQFAAAQSARIGIAKADLYPSFTLVGSVGLQTTSDFTGRSGGSLFESNSLTYVFGPRVTWSIFNYGRTKNLIRIQDARFQQLIVNYQDTVLKAAQEVEDGMIGFVNAQLAAESGARAVAAAQKSVDLAFTQYREGATDYERVLDAQRTLLQQENNLAQTRSSIATSLIALYKALGGGWEMRLGQPIVPDTMKDQMQQRTDWDGYFSPAPAPTP
jgi:NodT family efflux transporter outer membrane factor (OMF) lipoprotein